MTRSIRILFDAWFFFSLGGLEAILCQNYRGGEASLIHFDINRLQSQNGF